MNIIQHIRGVVTLLLIPGVTLVVSILTLIAVFIPGCSQRRVQILPRTWGKLICRIAGVQVRIEGAENLSADQTYIFVANHVSQFDIFCFQGYFPFDFRWIAKQELFRIPFFGPAMRRAGFISIDRSQGRAALRSLHEAAEKIAAGSSVLIFPEGTRSATGTLQPFKSGAVLLAIKAGVPVVPIGFCGTFEVLAKGRRLPRSGQVTIRVGSPITTERYKPADKQQLAQELHDRVCELLVPTNC